MHTPLRHFVGETCRWASQVSQLISRQTSIEEPRALFASVLALLAESITYPRRILPYSSTDDILVSQVPHQEQRAPLRPEDQDNSRRPKDERYVI